MMNWEFIRNWNLGWMHEQEMAYPVYAMLSIIHSCQKKTGWCELKKTSLSAFIKMGRTKTLEFINWAVKEGFLEKANRGKKLRTTDKWKAQFNKVEVQKLNLTSSETEPQTENEVQKLNLTSSETEPQTENEVQKLNPRSSETEPHEVQKLNLRGSETEPLYKDEQEVNKKLEQEGEQEGGISPSPKNQNEKKSSSLNPEEFQKEKVAEKRKGGIGVIYKKHLEGYIEDLKANQIWIEERCMALGRLGHKITSEDFIWWIETFRLSIDRESWVNLSELRGHIFNYINLKLEKSKKSKSYDKSNSRTKAEPKYGRAKASSLQALADQYANRRSDAGGVDTRL